MEEFSVEGNEEKFEIKSNRGIKLAGIINTPREGDELVIISHGLFANKDRRRLQKATYRFSRKGIATLRYDSSGCGESESIEHDLQGDVSDLKQMIAYARTRGYSTIALLGESYGGLVTLFAYDQDIKTVVLWGPVTGNRVPSFLKIEKYAKELSENGYVVYNEGGRDHKVTQKYVDDRNSINKRDLLSRIKCPVLIIHGSQDDQVSYKESEEAMEYLPKGSKFVLMEKGTHSLDNKIDRTIEKTIGWLKENDA